MVIGIHAYPVCKNNNGEMIAMPTIEPEKKITMDKFHRLLGHPGMQTTIETAKYYNINLLGEIEVCEACALAKTRQKNTKKVTVLAFWPMRAWRLFACFHHSRL
jgi:hypothetical protein